MQETQTTQQSLIKMGKKKWNEKIIYTLYIVSALIIVSRFLISFEIIYLLCSL